jgi:hypothetical protein
LSWPEIQPCFFHCPGWANLVAFLYDLLLSIISSLDCKTWRVFGQILFIASVAVEMSWLQMEEYVGHGSGAAHSCCTDVQWDFPVPLSTSLLLCQGA